MTFSQQKLYLFWCASSKKPHFVNRHGNVVVTWAGEVVIDSAKKKERKPETSYHKS